MRVSFLIDYLNKKICFYFIYVLIINNTYVDDFLCFHCGLHMEYIFITAFQKQKPSI